MGKKIVKQILLLSLVISLVMTGNLSVMAQEIGESIELSENVDADTGKEVKDADTENEEIDIETLPEETSNEVASDTSEEDTELVAEVVIEVPEEIKESNSNIRMASIVFGGALECSCTTHCTVDNFNEKCQACNYNYNACEVLDQTYSTLYITTRFEKYIGEVTYIIKVDGKEYKRATVNQSSTTRLEFPTGKYIEISCEINGEQELVYRSFYSASGVFTKEKYALTSKVKGYEICEHKNERIEEIPATILSVGSKKHICSDCGAIISIEEIEKLQCNHSNEKSSIIKAATDTTVGSKIVKCADCNKFIRTEEIPMIPHDYSWVVVKEATAKEEGLKEYTCKNCGAVSDQQIIPVIACRHTNYSWAIVQEPTCSKPKLKTATCNDCGHVIIENYNTKSYDDTIHEHLIEITLVEATYSTIGTKKITCSDCGYSYSEKIPKKECKHTRTGLSVDSDGNWWSICSDCGEKLGPSSYNTNNCTHNGYGRTRTLRQRIGENQDGIWDYLCNNCKQVVSTTTYPGYQVYTVETQHGTAEVYGYFVTDMPQEVWELTNTYRSENGLNTLNYASGIQKECDIRAVEAAVKFDHERPNGQRWYELNRSKMNGENLAMGYNTASTVMTAWKNSPGHNENLLYPTFKSLATSTFVKYSLTNSDGFPSKTYVSVQTFSCYSEP